MGNYGIMMQLRMIVSLNTSDIIHNEVIDPEIANKIVNLYNKSEADNQRYIEVMLKKNLGTFNQIVEMAEWD